MPRRTSPAVTLARCRVPPNRLLPSEDVAGWEDLVGVLADQKGCESVACSRVKGDPERVLFAIVWHDQNALDEFKTSPAYPEFINALPPGVSTETIKFEKCGTKMDFLHGWLSLVTIGFTHPVADVERVLFGHLGGPMRFQTRGQKPKRGWVQELRTLGSQTVQDAVLLRNWRYIVPVLDMQTEVAINPLTEEVFEKRLEEIGAVQWKEEHVNLARVDGIPM
ncbi:hypothetical protein QBC46DRAFT_420341 [Diplogelasinospora grovesii]|uniref:ABM domain-containing protein n=1 Tax=Diplogelasinospora grovesii TaxID=303347 RepID=A0AAN6S1A3_9PEZI|nr:hypothetical protein QBC46DRAFT_420341 [Diplogelasinospora grovesii]